MISRSPIISIFSLQSSSRSHAVWFHDLHGPPSAVPALVPLHFAARISLLGLQQVASIHALWSHDTSGSLHWFLAFVPSHVGLPPSHPTPSIHIMDRQSLIRTTHAVPDIGSSLVPLHFGSSTTIPRLHSRKLSSRPAQAQQAPGCFTFLPRP